MLSHADGRSATPAPHSAGAWDDAETSGRAEQGSSGEHSEDVLWYQRTGGAELSSPARRRKLGGGEDADNRDSGSNSDAAEGGAAQDMFRRRRVITDLNTHLSGSETDPGGEIFRALFDQSEFSGIWEDERVEGGDIYNETSRILSSGGGLGRGGPPEYVAIAGDNGGVAERARCCGIALASSGASRGHWVHRAKILARRTSYYIPVLGWLPRYRPWDLLSDVVAGIAVTSMLIPQSLAYATLANLPPVYGLYTAWLPLLVYFVLGTSRQLAIGPEALISILIGLTLREAKDDADPADLASTLSFLVGLFTLALGIVRFGFLDSVLSRPLLSGFIDAVAVITMVEQLDVLLGLSSDHAHSFQKVPYVIEHIEDAQWIAAVVGICTIGILSAFRLVKYVLPRQRWIKFIPETMVVVVLGIILSYGADLDAPGLPLLGEVAGSGAFLFMVAMNVLITSLSRLQIKSGFPTPRVPFFPSFSVFQRTIQPSLVIGVVGFIESIIVAKYYASKHNYPVSANRELVALGTANLLGSFFGTYPTFGSLTRSSVADAAGAKTQVYGLVASFGVLFTLLFLSPVFFYLPRVTMAGIIVVAAFGLIEWKDALFLYRVRAWKDLALLGATFLLTCVFGAELGIILSLGISIFIVIKTTSFPRVALLGRLPGTTKYVGGAVGACGLRWRLFVFACVAICTTIDNYCWRTVVRFVFVTLPYGSLTRRILQRYKDVTEYAEAEQVPGVLVMRIDEQLYFANIGILKDMLSRIERLGSYSAHPSEKPSVPPLRGIVIDARNLPEIDASALHTLLEMTEDYAERGVKVCFVKLRSMLKVPFLRASIIHPLGGDRLFTRAHDAVMFILGVDVAASCADERREDIYHSYSTYQPLY